MAIGYEQAPENTYLRSDWEVRDLRFVYLLSDGQVGPLCPAAFQGISSALMELALEDEVQDASALIQQLKTAIATNTLSPSALGFAQEHIFLTKLALYRDLHVSASLSSAANPTGMPGGIVFMFERVRLVWGFRTRSNAVARYRDYETSVLFIPRDPNEPYIDAAVYDYHTKSIYAMQVTKLPHFPVLQRSVVNADFPDRSRDKRSSNTTAVLTSLQKPAAINGKLWSLAVKQMNGSTNT